MKYFGNKINKDYNLFIYYVIILVEKSAGIIIVKC